MQRVLGIVEGGKTDWGPERQKEIGGQDTMEVRKKKKKKIDPMEIGLKSEKCTIQKKICSHANRGKKTNLT